ncbi:hypothetical protein B0H10DRAFT_2223866 [Mycena sp. CBHHK59/15]|nr:hypothetical protein B0H10DRAFT_2223866 [Mycena sp. CBHHK59/15]
MPTDIVAISSDTLSAFSGIILLSVPLTNPHECIVQLIPSMTRRRPRHLDSDVFPAFSGILPSAPMTSPTHRPTSALSTAHLSPPRETNPAHTRHHRPCNSRHPTPSPSESCHPAPPPSFPALAPANRHATSTV